MPELPEVQTVRDGLAPEMEGASFTRVTINRPDLRFPFPDRFSERLTGVKVEQILRRAKFLMVTLSSGETLLMHLGMSGRFTIDRGGAKLQPGDFVHVQSTNPKHDHVIFDFDNGTRIVFNDPRRFGFIELFPAAQPIQRLALLGPEPLSDEFSPISLRAALRGKKTRIKSALLDQRIVAGLGNIYVCEALFRAGISPRKAAGRLTMREVTSLTSHVKTILEEAIAAGGSTLRDYAGADGESGAFQNTFDVYGREGLPCKVCNAPIQRITQAGRSSFFCGTCQR